MASLKKSPLFYLLGNETMSSITQGDVFDYEVINSGEEIRLIRCNKDDRMIKLHNKKARVNNENYRA